jgi:hypothetical protein
MEIGRRLRDLMEIAALIEPGARAWLDHTTSRAARGPR